MSKKTAKTARLLVRYGPHRKGDEVTGDLAEILIDRGMAKDMTPSRTKKKTAPKTKAHKAAPENKGFEV